MTAIDLYARRLDGFEQRLAHTLSLLQDAAREHAGRIVFATSLGAEDMVLADLIARHRLPIALATLDTGMLHAETLALIARLEARYGLEVEIFRPAAQPVLHFVREHGERAMLRSIELRKACCGLRKLEPLARMLAGRSAWVTGLRREQSEARGELPFRDRDDAGRLKLNPLADWRWADVWQHIATHDVPCNPLHDQFMPSIGCAPCTRAIAVGEPFRAGRWWWESEDAKECGLHVKTHSADATASVSSLSEDFRVFASAQADFGAGEVKDAPASGRSRNDAAKECGLHVEHQDARHDVSHEEQAAASPIGAHA